MDEALNPTVVTPEASSPPAPRRVPVITGTKALLEGRSFEELQNLAWEFAGKIQTARFLNESIRGDQSSIFFVLMTSIDLGLNWTHGVRSLYMTPDGKLGVQGDILLALVQSRGFKIEIRESTDKGARIWMQRPDGTMEYEGSFTEQDAKRIMFKKKGYGNQQDQWLPVTEKYNYKAFAVDMYFWRAFMRTARRVAGDILGGIYHSTELEYVEETQEMYEQGAAPGSASNAEFKVGRKTQPPADGPLATPESAPASAPAPAAIAPPDPERTITMPPPKEPVPVATAAASAMAAPAPSAPAPAPQPPPAPAPAPEAAPAAATSEGDDLRDHMEALADWTWDHFGQKVSVDTVKKWFGGFYRGFFGVATLRGLKASTEDWKVALALLASYVYQGTDEIMSLQREPVVVGQTLKAEWDRLVAVMDARQWGIETIRLIIRIMQSENRAATPDGFVQWLTATKMIDADEIDLVHFLELFRGTRNAISAVKFARANNAPVHAVVRAILTYCKARTALEITDSMLADALAHPAALLPAPAAPATAPADPAEAPPEDDEESFGLFGTL